MQSDYGQLYAQMYHQHWWFRAREAILVREIERLGVPDSGEILDVGCGNGLFLPRLARWGRVSGIEVDRTLVTHDAPFRDRIYHDLLGSDTYRGSSFDLITALDVIEHIEDDQAAVSHMVGMLRPGGYLVVTVPAFGCLWDTHDEVNHHYRRYRKRMLHELLSPHGRIVELRYVFPSLFFFKWLVAKANRLRSRKITMAQSRLPNLRLSAWVSRYLCVEDRLAALCRPGVGSSLLAVMQKPHQVPFTQSTDRAAA